MKKILLIISLLLTTSLSGCSMKKPSACATNYPVYYLLQKIGGDYIDLCNLSSNDLIQVAQPINDFSNKLSEVDVVFYISGLEPYFSTHEDELINSDAELVDLAKTSAIYDFQRSTTTIVNDQRVVVDSPYYEGENFSRIDMYDKDAALWMDPNSMMSMADTIRQYFVDHYPENKSVFEDNFSELKYDLALLDAAYQNFKNENHQISFVVMTPNFGTWQRSYGFGVYPIILSRYGALPSDKQLAAIKERIQKDGVRYIAHEENLTLEMEALFEQLETELELKRINLYNISSITAETVGGNKDYLSLMYENLAQLEAIGE